MSSVNLYISSSYHPQTKPAAMKKRCMTCGDGVQNGELRVVKLVLLTLVMVVVAPGVMGSDCGGTYLDAKGNITSPNYPNKYPKNQQCVYTIKVRVLTCHRCSVLGCTPVYSIFFFIKAG